MKLISIIVLLATGLFSATPAEDLLTAARRGQLAEVKKLLESGAPIESKNQYGATPLYLAVFNAHKEVALFLLDKGAVPDVTDTFYKSSILDNALQKKLPEVASALIAKGVPATQRQLNLAVSSGNIPVLQAVLTAPFKPEDLSAALRAAIDAKNDPAAAVLRKAGAPEPKTVAVSQETLASYAGEYTSSALPIGIKLTAVDGKLQGQGEGQSPFTLTTDSPTEFSFAQAGIRMVFDGKGGFVLHQGGQQFPFLRKGAPGAAEIRKVSDTVLARYAGQYASEQLPMEITATGNEGRLTIQATGQQALPLVSVTDSEFTFAPAGVRILFSDEKSFTLFQAGQEFKFKKKEPAK